MPAVNVVVTRDEFIKVCGPGKKFSKVKTSSIE